MTTMSVSEERIRDLNRKFCEDMSDPQRVAECQKEIFDDLLDEVLMGFVFDVHRRTKTGLSDVEEGVPDDESFVIVDIPGMDIFGQHPAKKSSQECNCPNCDRGVAACRFVTHLEKCMGMGRNSSRIASRRIANNTKDLSNLSNDHGLVSDDEDDADWSANSGKRKRRKDCNGLKKVKKIVKLHKNGEASTSELVPTSNENSPTNYDTLSAEEKKTLLSSICGVVSEHTKKWCTRSIRCPQHSDEQRKEVRANVDLSFVSQSSQDTIDVDIFEDAEGQNLGGSLGRWDQEGSSHSSPADSTSTTSTSSLGRKEFKSKGKGKGSKRDRVSPQGD